MDFTKFFAPPQAPAKKRRAAKAKPPPKRLKQLPETPLPPKFNALLTSYDQLRQVARSLEAMRVRTTLAQLCGAVPQLQLTEETVRTCALACPRALTVDDSDGTPLVVFPKLSDSDRKRGSTYEAARRSTLENALRDSADAAHACWLAQRSLAPPADGFHEEFDEGPELGQAPKPSPPSPAKLKPAPPSDALLPLQRLAGEAWYEGQAVRVETLEKRPGRYASVTKPLPDQVRRFLQPLRLYEHQAKAIDASLDGADVALATGTASGKTLSYVVPALSAAASTDGCVALFLFPTKALAQDQLASLRRAIEACSLDASCSTLDGDTADEERQSIAQSPSTFIITNPDMLHYTLLPGASQRWRRLFDDLRYVVVDESHVYVGGFGAHVAAVLRRLQRLAPSCQYFACSATVRDASGHASSLLPPSSRQLVVIDDDASPRGPKQVVVWNPPLKKEKKIKRKKVEAETDEYNSDTEEYDEDQALQGEEKARAAMMLAERKALAVEGSDGEPIRRKSAIVEAARIVASLTSHGVRTLCFAKTRKLQELVLGYARERSSTRLAGYRGGYTPAERRRIESDFFEGRLDGVVATCALELGVDVGDLDATVHLGWPGSRCSLRQQAGRAGRDPSRASLAVVVLFNGPLDQLMAQKAPLLTGEVEPCALFVAARKSTSAAPPRRRAGAASMPWRSTRRVSTKPRHRRDDSARRRHETLISTRRSVANERVLRDQLLCAAAEAPLATEDRARFVGRRDGVIEEESGRVYDRALDSLRRDGSLVERSKVLCCRRSDTKHAKNVPLRVVDPVTIEVRINGIVLDTVPYARAFYELFEGAIYLHQARPHLVTRLDLQARFASVKRLRTCNYITASRNHTDVDPVRVLEARGPLKTGVVHVVSKVWGYRKVCRQTFKVLELKEFSLPPLEFDSRGTWVDVPSSAIERMASLSLDARSGVHAANHALLIVAPLFVVSDPSDIATEHVYPRQHRPRPLRLILYDARPGGLGAANALFRRFHAALGQARRLLSECPCRFSSGCPACLHVHTCSGYNANLDRRAARIIVDAVLSELRSICQPVVESPARAARLRDAAVGSRLGASAAVADAWAPSLPDFRPPVEG